VRRNGGIWLKVSEESTRSSQWILQVSKIDISGRKCSADIRLGVSSISGSASASSGSSASDSKVTRLLKKSHLNPTRSVVSDDEAEIADRQRRAHLRTAVIWFSRTSPIDSLGVPKDTQFGVHRALFPPFETAADYLGGLIDLQLHQNGDEEERRITLLMVAGGHFAGMVIGLRPRGKSDRQEVKGAGEVRVLQHKTFHRYTSEFSDICLVSRY